MLRVYAPIVAWWLGKTPLFCESIIAGSPWGNLETESLANGSLTDDRFISDSPASMETHGLYTNDLSAVGVESSLLSENLGTVVPIAREELSNEYARVSKSSNLNRSYKVQEQLLGSPYGLRIAALLICVSLGALIVRVIKNSGGSKPQEEHYYQRKQQTQLHQQAQERGSDERKSEGDWQQQVNELLQLQSVAVQLAEIVHDHEAHMALQNLWESVEKAKQVQQLLTDSSSPWDSPESVLQKALNKGLSALSQLYELSRQYGLNLVREARGVHPVREFSYEELKIMEVYLGSHTVEALENHMVSLRLSCRAFAWKLKETEAVLEGLPSLKSLEDGSLLDVVAANLKFISAAHDTATMGRQSAEHVASSAVAVTLSHVVRSQMRLYRDCRDLVEERRALCNGERERQQSLREQDPMVIRELDTVEALLNRGEQLLQQYKGLIEALQSERELTFAEAVRLQAEDAGKELKGVLDVAISRLDLSPLDVTDNVDMDEAYNAIASRARQEAAEASKRVSDVNKEVQSRFPPNWRISNKTLINEGMLNLLTGSLQQTDSNAKAASDQAGSAAAAIWEDSEQGTPTRELMVTARRAAVTAENLLGSAELLWLHTQLLESLEFDLGVSAKLANVGTMAENRQWWVSELSQESKLQVEVLQREVDIAKNLARSHWSAKDLALTASAMKNAAIGISILVQQQQLKETAGLII